MPTFNFPACYFAESRLILSCSSCIRPRWPQSRRPPPPRTCPALRQKTGPRARAASFFLPSTGQAGSGAVLAAQGADGSSFPALGAHSPAPLGSEERATSCLYTKPVCSSKGKRSFVWQVLTPLPSGNPAEKARTDRVCIKS